MFKKIISSIATAVLASGIGLTLAPKNNQEFISQQSDEITWHFNSSQSDETLSLETNGADFFNSVARTYRVYTIDFGSNNPRDFIFRNQAYDSNKTYMMQWGGSSYSYTNTLFNNAGRVGSINKELKVTTQSQIEQNVKTLMYHEEKSFAAGAITQLFDGFTYYYENGSYYVQWLVIFHAEGYWTSSNVFTSLSLGSTLTFTRA